MSQKITLAAVVAAVALLSTSTVEAKSLIQPAVIRPHIKPFHPSVLILEEEEWEANAGISGNGRGKPSWNVGISHKWDEESNDLQDLKSDLLKAAQVIIQANEMGIFDETVVAEQGLGKSVKKAVKIAAVVAESGLLEELIYDEEQSVKNVLTKVSKFAIAADQAGLLEEEQDEQKFKLGKTLNKIGKISGKIANGVGKAQAIGLLEEEEYDEQGLSFKKVKKAVNKVGKVAGKVSNAYDKAQQIGVLEEEEWEANAGISGNGRGKPSWNVGISHKWDEEQDEQKFKLGKTLNKIGKISGKVANGVGKAQAIGLLEEEEWEMNAGISGSGGKPSWNVGVSHKWEDAEEQGLSLKKVKKAVNKVGKVAGKVSNAYDKAQQIGVLEEEEWEMNAGISGNGGKPSWNVGISHQWDEPQVFSTRPTFLHRRLANTSPQ